MSRWAKLRCPHLEVLGKFEAVNPGGSIKDRVAKAMIQKVPPGCGVIESSSGNTAVGLAMVCAVQDRPLAVTMPDNQSNAKEVLLRQMGVQSVTRTPSAVPWYAPNSHVGAAAAMEKENKDNLKYVNQYTNTMNPAVHYATTGREILQQCGDRPPDVLIATVGTAGTLRGIGARLKRANPQCKVIGVEPRGSVIGLYRTGEKRNEVLFAQKRPWKVEGIGKDFIPPHLDPALIDDWTVVDDSDAFTAAREAIRTEGLLVGGSAGAALAGLAGLADRLAPGSRVVVILPDGARTYFSTFLDDGWMLLHGFAHPPPEFNPRWLSPVGEAQLCPRVLPADPEAEASQLLRFDAALFRVNDRLISKADLREGVVAAIRTNRVPCTVASLLPPHVTVSADTSLQETETRTREAQRVWNLRNPCVLVEDTNQCFDRETLVDYLTTLSC